ncbi:hypothetical protein GILI108418_16975 [Gillisia limnaea]|uniref:Uncharacterized protein n=2 Tax=Gillisia TaxID=244698 RepID=H2BXI1_GILLR|nr:hypothetical protein Gilli_1405 [Gillisia limnaea DSM 15749]
MLTDINFKLKIFIMEFELFGEFGGFLWWVLIRFCKTDLKEEQKEDKKPRNLIFLIGLGLLIGFISINFF